MLINVKICIQQGGYTSSVGRTIPLELLDLFLPKGFIIMPLGPSNDFPFLVQHSTLLSRPKPNTTHHVIVNLCTPYGKYGSVQHKLEYPYVENILEALYDLGPDILLSK